MTDTDFEINWDPVRAYAHKFRTEHVEVLGYSIRDVDNRITFYVYADIPLPPFPDTIADFEVFIRPLSRETIESFKD